MNTFNKYKHITNIKKNNTLTKDTNLSGDYRLTHRYEGYTFVCVL